MQANDMLRGYDDRDAHELREAAKATRDWKKRRHFLTVTDVTGTPITLNSGKYEDMVQAYNHWWKLCKSSAMTSTEGTDLITFTIKRGDGQIMRTFTARMA